LQNKIACVLANKKAPRKRGAFLMQKNAPENPGHFYYDFKYGKR